MNEILCDNIFCIYWLDGMCILDSTTHDTIGVCTQCIHVEIDKKLLNAKRIEMIRDLHINDSDD